MCVPVFGSLGLYRQVVRHMGTHALRPVLIGATITALVIAAVAHMVPLKGFPRSVPIIFWLLTLVYVGGTRYLARSYFHWLRTRGPGRKRVVIYGASDSGVSVARSLVNRGDYLPVAFVDENDALRRRVIDGLTVHAPEELADLVERYQAGEAVIAIESSAPAARYRAIRNAEKLDVRVKVIPDADEIAAGRERLSDIRDVEVEDLLGRDQVDALPHLVEGSVRDRVVMVTGAGGSIGSELCRQIVRCQPRVLVLLDHSEFALFQIQSELRRVVAHESLQVPIVTVLGSVVNETLMSRTFSRYRVETVYHAAAYKHVDMVEHNVVQGLKNNTFGTLYCALAALDAGVKDFILISTDKAVRTSSVMGASKRLAEMVLQALQPTAGGTRFSMVRFGNVLGSSGSVVPLFLEQIDRGGPVTVTHRDVTRYFMTIPEAAQLVLQAASLAQGGDVFLLDMGKPVRILDLAKRMIRLKGLRVKDVDDPGGDIEIDFTGLKPGEKLHEELLVGQAVVGTEHRKILRAQEQFVPWEELRGALNTLEEACESFDFEAVQRFLVNLVEGTGLEERVKEASVTAEVVAITEAQIAARKRQS